MSLDGLVNVLLFRLPQDARRQMRQIAFSHEAEIVQHFSQQASAQDSFNSFLLSIECNRLAVSCSITSQPQPFNLRVWHFLFYYVSLQSRIHLNLLKQYRSEEEER
jgi:hypothetical protein